MRCPGWSWVRETKNKTTNTEQSASAELPSAESDTTTHFHTDPTCTFCYQSKPRGSRSHMQISFRKKACLRDDCRWKLKTICRRWSSGGCLPTIMGSQVKGPHWLGHPLSEPEAGVGRIRARERLNSVPNTGLAWEWNLELAYLLSFRIWFLAGPHTGSTLRKGPFIRNKKKGQIRKTRPEERKRAEPEKAGPHKHSYLRKQSSACNEDCDWSS